MPDLDPNTFRELFPGAPQNAGFWALFTRAEAHLLIGLLKRSDTNLKEAAKQYNRGVKTGRKLHLISDCQSALNQMRFHLKILHPKEALRTLFELSHKHLEG